MKRIIFIAPLFVILVACTQSADNEPIKIGLITPLTGDIASLGTDIYNGALLKLEEINAAGGINGRKVELIAEDGRCTGSDAASAAQKLINIDKVVAIHGAGCSGETIAAAPIAEAAKIVMMSPSSSSPDITDAGDFIFRTYPSDAFKTKAMANYFAEKGLVNIAIISENTDFSEAFRASLKSDVGDSGKFVFDEVVEPNTKDFRTLMTRLKDVDFDVFVLNPQTPPAGAAMLLQLREMGIDKLAVGHDVLDAKDVIKLAGEASNGLQVINVRKISGDSEFAKKFIAKYGDAQSMLSWPAYGYDTLGVISDAIAAVGTDGPAMRDYFYALDGYDGVTGTFSFDENGDVVGSKYALKEVKDGKFVKVADIVVD